MFVLQTQIEKMKGKLTIISGPYFWYVHSVCEKRIHSNTYEGQTLQLVEMVRKRNSRLFKTQMQFKSADLGKFWGRVNGRQTEQ